MKRRTTGWLAAICAGMCLAMTAQAQNSGAVPVLMVSDIHFEPFWDPAKVQKLASAPVPQWEAILAAPDSAGRAQQFDALETRCKAKGEDTSFPLLASSLGAMKTDAAGARFITLSGDLIAHKFSCKFKKILPQANPAAYQDFVEKTIGFVEFELRKTFPGVPVYAALGNNDSDCEDYALDPESSFLSKAGSVLTADVPKADRAEAENSFTAYGDYSVPLPGLHETRFLVLDNLFASVKYQTCGGRPDSAPAEAQVAWLRTQLERARSHHEQIWVMSHIPPGVDPYSTIRGMKNICGGAAPTLFLSSDALAETLAEFGDVVRLAIFAHTHMDELRLLRPATGDRKTGPAVALKMVPSISPVDGNNPSFVVAQVDAATATLKDYKVIAASDKSGTRWSEEYDFDKAYDQPEFSGATLSNLIAGFRADPRAQSAGSQEYLKDYFVKDASLELKLFWPQYVCALDNTRADSYRTCVCAAGK